MYKVLEYPSSEGLGRCDAASYNSMELQTYVAQHHSWSGVILGELTTFALTTACNFMEERWCTDPAELGKPHILPLCLKEGSKERSHIKKKNTYFCPQCRMRHLQRDGQLKMGAERIWMLLLKAQIVLRTSDLSQCKPEALVAAGRDCCVSFFNLHKRSLDIQRIPFPCVKEGKAINLVWQIFQCSRW